MCIGSIYSISDDQHGSLPETTLEIPQNLPADDMDILQIDSDINGCISFSDTLMVKMLT